MQNRCLTILLPALALLMPGVALGEGPSQPNIILIIADDLSWGDLGCYGQQKIKTPNIDRIATEGMQFQSCYAGNAVCAPSRSALMQGLHPGHARIRGNYFGRYRHSLTLSDVTVPMVLQQAGYTTGLLGKWGIGMPGTDGFPTKKGFDKFCGFANQQHGKALYPDHYWRDDNRVPIPENRGFQTPTDKPAEYTSDGKCIPPGIADPAKAVYQTDIFHREALPFVQENKDGPFFLYYASALPHGPLIVPDLAPYTDADWPSIRHKEWAAMITRLDTEVGRILKLLEDLSIDENTIVFFVSDNGVSASGYFRGGQGPNLRQFFETDPPLRGQKGNLFAGGLLVPAMARWPGKISPGSVSDHAWAFWDFLPTAAELAGAPIPENIDGLSIVPTLLGKASDQQNHTHFYWELGKQRAAHFEKYWAIQPRGEPIQVYNIEVDPQQRHDLSEERPDLAAKAERIFREEHTPNEVWPGPAETDAEFKSRMAKLGITGWPNNFFD